MLVGITDLKSVFLNYISTCIYSKLCNPIWKTEITIIINLGIFGFDIPCLEPSGMEYRWIELTNQDNRTSGYIWLNNHVSVHSYQ